MDFKYAKTNFLNVVYSFSTDNIILKTLIASCLSFLNIASYIYAVFALVVIDVITGVIASIKKGESFKSKILKKGLVEKFFLYVLMLIAVFILEKIMKNIFTYQEYYFVFLAAFLISSYEVVSIFENVLSINPKLTFIRGLIKLTNKLSDKAMEDSDDKVKLK